LKKTISTLTVLLFAAAACAGAGSSQTNVTAPDFSLRDLQGRTHTLSDYEGKVLVLNFWATWCPPCRAEIPDFVEAYDELNGQGLEIVGVTVEDISAEDLEDFAGGMKMNYTVTFGNNEIVRAYRPGQYIPATIIIDKKGVIRHRHVGAMEKAALLKVVSPLLEE
jgi:cytochrome c biogenesis protein CcmG/thiol:disulfide interchange protein DsbE